MIRYLTRTAPPTLLLLAAACAAIGFRAPVSYPAWPAAAADLGGLIDRLAAHPDNWGRAEYGNLLRGVEIAYREKNRVLCRRIARELLERAHRAFLAVGDWWSAAECQLYLGQVLRRMERWTSANASLWPSAPAGRTAGRPALEHPRPWNTRRP